MHNEESRFLELFDFAFLLVAAQLFPYYTQACLPLRSQSASGRSFGGLEPLPGQQNGLLASDSAVTSSFGNVFDLSIHNRTGFLANDPLSSAVDWNFMQNGSQPLRRMFLSIFSSIG